MKQKHHYQVTTVQSSLQENLQTQLTCKKPNNTEIQKVGNSSTTLHSNITTTFHSNINMEYYITPQQ